MIKICKLKISTGLCCNRDTWVCGVSFKTWSNFLPLPRARYKTTPKFSKNLIHLHLLKFTCCKQDLHWRSSNLGQEVLKKTPFATPGCGDGGENHHENIHVDVTPRAGRWGLPPLLCHSQHKSSWAGAVPERGSRQDLQPHSSRTLSQMEIPAALFFNKNGIYY